MYWHPPPTPQCNCTNKVNFPPQGGKCQYEWIVYKVEIHSCRPNDNNICSNDKKICRFYTKPFKKNITIIEVVLHTHIYIYIYIYIYICPELIYPCGEIKKNLGTDPILKWEIVKFSKMLSIYKADDRYYNLCNGGKTYDHKIPMHFLTKCQK